MNRYAQRAFGALLAAIVAFGLLAPPPAQAGTIEDVAGVLDYVDQHAHGSLPFTGADLIAMRDLINGCSAASDVDDVVTCVDGALSSKAGQEADIPSWVPQLLHVYLDISHKDYWGLLEDASLAAACAIAQVVAFGVDVCGAIKELVDLAKAVASDAEAVAAFLAGVATTIADLSKDVYCWFASCDDTAGAPAPETVAYQSFYFPRIPEGVSKRLAGSDVWSAYAGSPNTTQQGSIVSAGESAGFHEDALLKALPAFRDAVYVQWDSRILALVPAVIAVRDAWNAPAKAANYVAPGMANWKPDMTSELSFGTGLAPLLKPGHTACVAAVASAGGPQVDAWVQEGRPQKAKLPPGFTWPSGYQQLCGGFDKQLENALRPAVIQKASAFVLASCPKQDGNPPTYRCGNAYVADSCKSLMAFEGMPASSCVVVNTGPGVIPFICPGGVVKRLPVTGPHPPGCKPAQVNGTPNPAAGRPI